MAIATRRSPLSVARLERADQFSEANADLATTSGATFWGGPAAGQFSAGVGFGSPAEGSLPVTLTPKLTTLVSFTGADGANPEGGLIADAAGDLFGTTSGIGNGTNGTVFEIAKTAGGYASAPITLVSFTGADGAYPFNNLIADAAGDLFGTTQGSGHGVDGLGTVFEIPKANSGYASKPTTLVTFTGADGAYPQGGLITNAEGDLFGTTNQGGPYVAGTVFEIVKTASGYANAPTTLVNFTGRDGSGPFCSLITDAAGDLFGTTNSGGANGDGTVFEVAKTKSGYASKPTILVSFSGADGANPVGGLIADGAGDLFGTTSNGGADDDGTVFEIARTSGGYASALTTLVSFNDADGQSPESTVILDAAGDLLGTTSTGGANGEGTVFEITRTAHGYANAPTILVSFGANGAYPDGNLIVDSAENLFGTTFNGGADGHGTVFELAKVTGGYSLVTSTNAVTPTGVELTHWSPPPVAFVEAMSVHGAAPFGSGIPSVVASRNETPALLSRPQFA